MNNIGERIISGLEEFADSLDNNKPVTTTRFYYDEEGNLVRERCKMPVGELFDEQDRTNHTVGQN